MTRPSILAPMLFLSLMVNAMAADIQLSLRSKNAASGETTTRIESWKPAETAIIVCDAWDYHHCLNAVRRLEQFAPRLNDVLINARKRGVTIIHAPSDCMDSYKEHPARRRAIDTTKATDLPHEIESLPYGIESPYDIESWCSAIPAEESAVYPIDQSDGGEDDDPKEHAEWAAKLEAMGRNPNMPWKKQTDTIKIDPQNDFISDRGDEVWNVLQSRGINNVILVGVHTNMCVLGRPFGLRQLARNGKHVVLMRDMTDTMYNPERWPFVSHFEGTRRIIGHIERYVCPTISSDQLIGGREFRFEGDDGKPTTSLGKSQPAPDFWELVKVSTDSTVDSASSQQTLRSVVRVPSDWLDQPLSLVIKNPNAEVWCNGQPLKKDGNAFVVENVNCR